MATRGRLKAKPRAAKSPCPKCGKEVIHMASHLRQVHGMTGGMRAVNKAAAGAESSPVKASANGKGGGFTEMPDLKVLRDASGVLWIAERIQ